MSDSNGALRVSVTRVLYPPAVETDARWFVLLTDKGKCSGSMLWRPESGERLKLDGKWGAYKGDRNFKFTAAMPDVPGNPRDQLLYVCERAVGIGPAMCEAIWDARGDDWRNVEAGEVPRLTGAKFTALQEAIAIFDSEQEKSETISWLMGKGATVNLATVAWDEWAKETIGVVQTNCYRLADLQHYGFVHIDGGIRHEFGIADDDPRRVHAAILYSIGQLTASGSTVIEWSQVRDYTSKLIGGHQGKLIAELVKEMFADGSLKGFEGTQSIALGADYRDEREVWDWSRRGAA